MHIDPRGNYEYLQGRRIRLTHMSDDPDPIPSGTTGTILFANVFDNALNVTVEWDVQRGLSLVCPPDRFELINEES